MNKFGIKVYGSGVDYFSNIYYNVNSINHPTYGYNYKSRYRMIDSKCFGINLDIITKRR